MGRKADTRVKALGGQTVGKVHGEGLLGKVGQEQGFFEGALTRPSAGSFQGRPVQYPSRQRPLLLG